MFISITMESNNMEAYFLLDAWEALVWVEKYGVEVSQ